MIEIKILSTTAILGYGFPMASFEAGMAHHPDCIAVDAGSTDPGPYYLGAGVSFTDRFAVKRDLGIMIAAGIEHHIPVLVGTAGGSGAKPHLDWTLDIIREIALEQGLHFKMAVITADFDSADVLAAHRAGQLKPLHPAPEASEDDIIQSTHIVGQMGVEPYLEALKTGADVIVAGRAYDPAVFAALPILKGFDKGLALHCGKILECAAIASTPGSGSDCMLGTITEDSFILQTLNPVRRCTTLSVSAHTLYEKTDPYVLPGPGGTIDLHDCVFTQLDEQRVEVKGSRFIPSNPYTIKLEASKVVGYRTVSIAGVRDPFFIQKVDAIIDGVTQRVNDNFKTLKDYHLNFKVYGRDGVMGSLETQKVITSHELAIVIDAVAPTQEVANTICSFARSTMLHYGYEGRIATAGNLAFPYSPSDFKVGPVYNFSLYHLLAVSDPVAPFKLSLITL
jgi:hypothetical protein